MRCVSGILLSLLVSAIVTAQTSRSIATSPSVTIQLPLDISSEGVQVAYNMSGPFGGFGAQTPSRAGLRTIRIDASYEGRAATEIKVIAYAPGCHFMTRSFSLVDVQDRIEPFTCKSVAKMSIMGRMPSALTGNLDAELFVTYSAYWAHEFFGKLDGFVTEFTIATVPVAIDGTFRVELPDLSSMNKDSSSFSGGEFHLLLRDKKTWNHLAYLTPEVEDLKTSLAGMKAQSSYPANIDFVSQPRR